MPYTTVAVADTPLQETASKRHKKKAYTHAAVIESKRENERHGYCSFITHQIEQMEKLDPIHVRREIESESELCACSCALMRSRSQYKVWMRNRKIYIFYANGTCNVLQSMWPWIFSHPYIFAHAHSIIQNSSPSQRNTPHNVCARVCLCVVHIQFVRSFSIFIGTDIHMGSKKKKTSIFLVETMCDFICWRIFIIHIPLLYANCFFSSFSVLFHDRMTNDKSTPSAWHFREQMPKLFDFVKCGENKRKKRNRISWPNGFYTKYIK